jgi:hypothetical protein
VLKTKIPPPIYMLLFVGMMWLLDQQFPLIDYLGNPWNKLGLIFIGVDLLLDFWSLFLFSQNHTQTNESK